MKQVTAYQTEDGKVFYDISEAVQHEAKLQIAAIIEEEGFRGMSTDDVVTIIMDKAFYIHRALDRAMEYTTVPASEDDS